MIPAWRINKILNRNMQLPAMQGGNFASTKKELRKNTLIHAKSFEKMEISSENSFSSST